MSCGKGQALLVLALLLVLIVPPCRRTHTPLQGPYDARWAGWACGCRCCPPPWCLRSSAERPSASMLLGIVTLFATLLSACAPSQVHPTRAATQPFEQGFRDLVGFCVCRRPVSAVVCGSRALLSAGWLLQAQESGRVLPHFVTHCHFVADIRRGA